MPTPRNPKHVPHARVVAVSYGPTAVPAKAHPKATEAQVSATGQRGSRVRIALGSTAAYVPNAPSTRANQWLDLTPEDARTLGVALLVAAARFDAPGAPDPVPPLLRAARAAEALHVAEVEGASGEPATPAPTAVCQRCSGTGWIGCHCEDDGEDCDNCGGELSVPCDRCGSAAEVTP